MDGKQIVKAVVLVMLIMILVPVAALVVGTVLTQSVFSSLTIINTTELSNAFGLFVTGLIGFLGVTGTIIAIVWFIGYVKTLFDKKTGIQSFAGS